MIWSGEKETRFHFEKFVFSDRYKAVQSQSGPTQEDRTHKTGLWLPFAVHHIQLLLNYISWSQRPGEAWIPFTVTPVTSNTPFFMYMSDHTKDTTAYGKPKHAWPYFCVCYHTLSLHSLPCPAQSNTNSTRSLTTSAVWKCQLLELTCIVPSPAVPSSSMPLTTLFLGLGEVGESIPLSVAFWNIVSEEEHHR